MQDRYAGDIGDYGKIALLRELQTQGLSVAVNWYRTEPLKTEKKADGTYKQDDGKYLIPEKLKVCDKDLADRLTRIYMIIRHDLDGKKYLYDVINEKKRATRLAVKKLLTRTVKTRFFQAENSTIPPEKSRGK